MATEVGGDGRSGSREHTLDDFHSEDPAMMRCLDLARVAAGTDLPILILGESGTGKTLLARAIHYSSPRGKGPFVSFNAAALSDTLLDSQLFGHERGAFTGADRRVLGKFELADEGTIFLDEIADMSLAAQAKILRAVEYGEFERLGSEKVRVASVRLVSATHLPLRQYIESDRFRKDLFYRLSGITLTLPPLRDRPLDLRSLIASEIVAASQRQCKTVVGLDAEAMDRLVAYAWPGNLRELNRVIHVAVAFSPGEIIPAAALILEPPAPGEHHPAEGKRPHPDASHALKLESVERQHIRRVLEQMGGNKRQAAIALGISRSTLDRKLAPAPRARSASV